MGNPVNKVDVWGYAERGVINWSGCLINCQSTAVDILNPQIGLIGENQVTGTAGNGYYSWNGSSYSSVTLTMDTRIYGAESKEAVRMYEKAYNNINSGYLEELKGYTHNYNRTALSYQKELRYKTNRTYHNNVIETAWYMVSQQSREGEERKRNRELTGLDVTNQEYNEYEATQNYLKAKEEYEIHILIGEYISSKGIEEEDIIKGYNEKTKTLYTKLIALEGQARSEGYYVENDRISAEITGNVGKGWVVSTAAILTAGAFPIGFLGATGTVAQGAGVITTAGISLNGLGSGCIERSCNIMEYGSIYGGAVLGGKFAEGVVGGGILMLQQVGGGKSQESTFVSRGSTERTERNSVTHVNLTSEAKLVNGYYEVNGFKFSEHYYYKLWNTGRKAPSLIAKEVLVSNPTVTADKMYGFFRYESSGWEMIYNPTTKELWHLMPNK
ncbi:MAG: hypothetical protein NG784_15690 [Candidatus Jettenia sp.]|nr:hypothetical protein [Candidatus Jettenia sp.]